MYLAAATVFKGETPWLREWVEYHRLVGVEHFYMASNDVDPEAARKELEPYIKSGLVTFRHTPDLPKLQQTVFLSALETLKNRTRWIAFLDLDEFVVPRKGDSISNLLKRRYDLPMVGGLVVHWKVFGSGNHKVHPKDKLQMEAYTIRIRDRAVFHSTVKTILKADAAGLPVGSHAWTYREGYYPVNEYREPVEAGSHMDPRITFDWIAIHHYMTRSRSDYETKIARGWPPGGGASVAAEERWKIWDTIHGEKTVIDDELGRRFSGSVKENLIRTRCPG